MSGKPKPKLIRASATPTPRPSPTKPTAAGGRGAAAAPEPSPAKPPALPAFEDTRRHPKAHRFTKKQRGAVVVAIANAMKRRIAYDPTAMMQEIRRLYGVSEETAWHLIADARDYLATRFGGSKALLRGEVASFLTMLTDDPEATVSEKIAAVDRIAKLYGLNAPDRVVNANIDANAAAGGQRIPADLLQQMHAELAGNPAAMEAAHRICEALGAKEAAAEQPPANVPPHAEPAEPPPEYGLKELPPKPRPKVGFVAAAGNGNGAH